jgi:hypothetical protein
MRTIKTLQPPHWSLGVSIGLHHYEQAKKEVLMKSDYPSPHTPERKDEISPPTSRFLDEKISDDSGAEANTNSALAPAGLDNPFWN